MGLVSMSGIGLAVLDEYSFWFAGRPLPLPARCFAVEPGGCEFMDPGRGLGCRDTKGNSALLEVEGVLGGSVGRNGGLRWELG